MEIEELIQKLQPALAAPLLEALKEQLAEGVAYLIEHDFDRLVQLLYTIDVDERRLKITLQQQPETQASVLITELIIERQLQKVAVRQQGPTGTAATDEERW